jgi:hypothetical protein
MRSPSETFPHLLPSDGRMRTITMRVGQLSDAFLNIIFSFRTTFQVIYSFYSIRLKLYPTTSRRSVPYWLPKIACSLYSPLSPHLKAALFIRRLRARNTVMTKYLPDMESHFCKLIKFRSEFQLRPKLDSTHNIYRTHFNVTFGTI